MFSLTSKFHDNRVNTFGFMEGGLLKSHPPPRPRNSKKAKGGIGLSFCSIVNLSSKNERNVLVTIHIFRNRTSIWVFCIQDKPYDSKFDVIRFRLKEEIPDLQRLLSDIEGKTKLCVYLPNNNNNFISMLCVYRYII